MCGVEVQKVKVHNYYNYIKQQGGEPEPVGSCVYIALPRVVCDEQAFDHVNIHLDTMVGRIAHVTKLDKHYVKLNGEGKPQSYTNQQGRTDQSG